MSKYKVEINYSDGTNDLLDEVFDSEEEAREYGYTEIEAYDQGGEILELSNPGDYPYDEEDEIDISVIEVDD